MLTTERTSAVDVINFNPREHTDNKRKSIVKTQKQKVKHNPFNSGKLRTC